MTEPPKTTHFIVMRWGVYIQGVIGVFSTEEKAQAALEEARKAEYDRYHTFGVLPIEVDRAYPEGSFAG